MFKNEEDRIFSPSCCCFTPKGPISNQLVGIPLGIPGPDERKGQKMELGNLVPQTIRGD
jgi:hypothetical protein